MVPFGPSPLVAVVTTRDIDENEELLTSYGASYWLDMLPSSPDDNEDCITDEVMKEVRALAMDLFEVSGSIAVKNSKNSQILSSIMNSMDGYEYTKWNELHKSAMFALASCECAGAQKTMGVPSSETINEGRFTKPEGWSSMTKKEKWAWKKSFKM